jgi:hypothetical protein
LFGLPIRISAQGSGKPLSPANAEGRERWPSKAAFLKALDLARQNLREHGGADGGAQYCLLKAEPTLHMAP